MISICAFMIYRRQTPVDESSRLSLSLSVYIIGRDIILHMRDIRMRLDFHSRQLEILLLIDSLRVPRISVRVALGI